MSLHTCNTCQRPTSGHSPDCPNHPLNLRANDSRSSICSAVFEAIDSTDDEIYYPIGIYASLDDAISELTKGEGEEGFTPPGGDGAWDKEDIASVAIYERKIGGYGKGKKVWSRTWTQDYSEDLDEYPWTPDLKQNGKDMP